MQRAKADYWHHAGSRRQKVKDGGIKENGKTDKGMEKRGKCREVTAREAKLRKDLVVSDWH